MFQALGDLRGKATSLWMLGYVASMRSNGVKAHTLEEEALALFREVNDSWGIIASLERLASIALDDSYTQAYTFSEESLLLARKVGDIWSVARALQMMGFASYFHGDFARAQPLLEECLTVSQQVGDKRTRTYALILLGYIALWSGDYDKARSLLNEGIEISKSLGDQRGMVWGITGLGAVALEKEDYAAARACYEQSLAILGKLGYKHTSFVALCLEGLAGVVIAQGHAIWAARLWGAAEAIREDYATPVPPVVRHSYNRVMTTIRTQLGEDVFDRGRAEGKAMTPEQVLGVQGQTVEPGWMVPVPLPTSLTKKTPAYTDPNGLTIREIEVLRLVAQGRTDKQIADQLVISPRTVNSHLTSIYRKIQVTSRSAATRYALDHQLT